jgi:hypothetical protein
VPGARLGLTGSIAAFDRRFFGSAELCTRIGGGELGGKARGLLATRAVIAGLDLDPAWGITVDIPRMIVVGTAVFDEFLRAGGPDLTGATADDRMAHAFTQAALPVEWLGDFQAIVDETHTPLAVRSSSLLEDALGRPFAGVYATKMIPNNQPDPDARFRRLVEAVKLVYASTFFRGARGYRRAAGIADDEKMAVLIQEVIGTRYDERFYPAVSGVARSYNFYPGGAARREDGVVNLALGLGKTIVDGGRCWVYAPARPAAPPPHGSADEQMDQTQHEFWAVNMGRPPAFDPTAETEFLLRASLADAEYDGTLEYVASTYDPAADRFYAGTGRPGPRLLDFAPLLRLRRFALNEVIRRMLAGCEAALGGPVEIEFALAIGNGPAPTARLGFLQARPMVIPEERITVTDADWDAPSLVARSDRALGNGIEPGLTDLVYVRPDRFDARDTPRIAADLRVMNDRLVAEGRPYILLGFGRWGSSDPWLGIPVAWGDIAGARVLVEATLERMDVEASQGAHFFHNLSSFGVSYLSVHHAARPGIAWDWLATLPAVAETGLVRHVRAPAPLMVKVDGRTGRGGIWRREEP